MEHNLKNLKMKEEIIYFIKFKAINALLLSIALTFLSCAKNKAYETVYKTPETIEKSNLVSTDDTYMYLPSTLQTPRAQSNVSGFFQGDQKLVKFRYTEKNLEIIELDSDSRFSANEQNASPVISIPVTYKDYNCVENAQKECSQKEQENTETLWSNKKFVLPDYSALKVNEVNSLDLTTINLSCANLTDTKLVNYEINSSTLNIELERTYQTSTDWNCISQLYRDDELKNASFKVRFFYSFVKLNTLTSPDFKPFVYDKGDQNTFGYFKTEIKKLNKYFDFNRIESQHFAHHWNPSRKSIVFYLDPKFYSEENKTLLKATEESFKTINEGLKQAGTSLQINIGGKATTSSGDLRFSRINLLDEPQATGLLGYGPAVANPLTGEIVQAHINMYSGSLIQSIRGTYQSMVDLGFNEQQKDESISLAQGAGHSKVKAANKFKNSLNAQILTTSKANDKLIKLSETSKINSLLSTQKQRPKMSNSNFKKNKLELNSLKLEEEKNNILKANHTICSSELINFAKITKKELPNIRLIPGVVSSTGKLISWDLLTDEARQGVLDLILPIAYIQTLVHEIGHTLGLRHNFMGSYDKANFYTKEESDFLGLHTIPVYSSIMDYGKSDLNGLAIFGKYDVAALRYMYAKKVETKDGQYTDVISSIQDIKVPLKKYLFCTDESAGNSVPCNRFDEGSTLTEIATNISENYDNSYKYKYFRNGRTKFDAYGVDELTINRYTDFQSARQIFEAYELYSSLFGEGLMEVGCSVEEAREFPICSDINDTREATLVIARMFLNILKTPDLTCDVQTLAGVEIGKRQLVNLTNLINDEIGYSANYTPKGCFDPAVIKYFSEKDQRVIAQGGKFLNSIQEFDPKYKNDSSDISIRGNFQDKLLALQFLVTRYIGGAGNEEIQGSMMDIPSVALEVNNYFDHILTGKSLINPVQFTDVNGKEIFLDVQYSLSHDSVIPEPATELIASYFGFPENANAEFNRLALITAKKFSKSNDVAYRLKAANFEASLSVVRSHKIKFFTNDIPGIVSTPVDEYMYSSTNYNTYANKMLSSIISERVLLTTDPKTILKVMIIKNNKVEYPIEYTEAEKAFSMLPDPLKVQILKFKIDANPLTHEILAPQVGDDLAKLIMHSYQLSETQMKSIVDLVIEKTSLGKDATEVEQAIYSMDSEVVDRFLNGTLPIVNELYTKSLDIMIPID